MEEKDNTLQIKIEIKLKWALEEKKKGLELIEKQLIQLQDNKNILNEIEAVITVLTELLNTIKDPKKD